MSTRALKYQKHEIEDPEHLYGVKGSDVFFQGMIQRNLDKTSIYLNKTWHRKARERKQTLKTTQTAQKSHRHQKSDFRLDKQISTKKAKIGRPQSAAVIKKSFTTAGMRNASKISKERVKRRKSIVDDSLLLRSFEEDYIKSEESVVRIEDVAEGVGGLGSGGLYEKEVKALKKRFGVVEKKKRAGKKKNGDGKSRGDKEDSRKLQNYDV